MDERINKQLSFILEIDKVKNIYRKTHLSNFGKRENDAEHSWHIAIMSYLLKEYSNEEIDIGKVMIMCLIHDIVEVYAGDTYAYDIEGLRTQKQREDIAKEKIFSLLPDEQKREFIALFDEFEGGQTPEARFARAMDTMQPVLLNSSNEGLDWKENQVCARQVYNRQSRTKLGSLKLYDVMDEIIQNNIKNGHLKEE